MPPTSGADLIVQRIAAYGLPGGGRLPDAPLAPRDWEVVLSKVRAHRIVGFLMRAVQDGRFAVDREQRGQVVHLYRQTRCYTVALQGQLVRLTGLLEQGGVEYRVLKGAALAALAYPDQSLRSYGDIDILVSPVQFEYTVGLLEREGYRRTAGWHRVGHAHDKSTVLSTAGGYLVDLHYALARGPYKWLIPTADLFAEPQTFLLGTRLLPTLPPAEQFLHVCLHARIGNIPLRLLSIRDVVQCAVSTQFSWAVVQQLCVKWRMSGVVGASIRTAQDCLGIDLGDSAQLLANYQPSSRERRLMRPYEAQSYTAFVISALVTTPGMARKVDHAYNLLLPGKQHLSGNGYTSHRARWRRVSRAITGHIAGRLKRHDHIAP
jgi:Uncharacterised nucleotidyltransferase